jgi:hypothetical protein
MARGFESISIRAEEYVSSTVSDVVKDSSRKQLLGVWRVVASEVSSMSDQLTADSDATKAEEEGTD